MWIWLTLTALAADPHVLVWQDAQLLSAPHKDATVVQANAKKVGREGNLHKVAYAQKVAEHGNFVELRTTFYSGACYPSLSSNAPPGLIVFVRKKDIVEVTTKPISISGDDGTRLLIDPGVAVRKNDDGRWSVATPDLKMNVKLSEAQVGRTYKAAPAEQSGYIPTHTAAPESTFSGKGFDLTVTARARSGKDGGNWIVHERCVTATAHHDTGAKPAADGYTGGGSNTTRAIRIKGEAWVLPKGSPMFWPDGATAGELIAPYRLMVDTEPDPKGLICGKSAAFRAIVCGPDPDHPEDVPKGIRQTHPSQLDIISVDPKRPKGVPKNETERCQASVDLNKKGEPTLVTVSQCADPWRTAAREAVKTWSFKPWMVDGKATPVRTHLAVEFKSK